MITGDHTLTACHVATELGICQSSPLILNMGSRGAAASATPAPAAHSGTAGRLPFVPLSMQRVDRLLALSRALLCVVQKGAVQLWWESADGAITLDFVSVAIIVFCFDLPPPWLVIGCAYTLYDMMMSCRTPLESHSSVTATLCASLAQSWSFFFTQTATADVNNSSRKFAPSIQLHCIAPGCLRCSLWVSMLCWLLLWLL